jgi:hypothetical protein
MCSIGITCGCGGNLSKHQNSAIDGRREKRLAPCLLKLPVCRMGVIKSIVCYRGRWAPTSLPLNSGRFGFCCSRVFQCTLSSTPIANVIQFRADQLVAPSSPRMSKKCSPENLDEYHIYCRGGVDEVLSWS